MTTNAPAHGSLDYGLALSRVGGDEELLKELAFLFLEEYPKLMDDLRGARRAGDMLGVERAAHSLKGSVANFGARDAVAASAEIEQSARAADLATVDKMLATLETTIVTLHKELAEL